MVNNVGNGVGGGDRTSLISRGFRFLVDAFPAALARFNTYAEYPNEELGICCHIMEDVDENH